MNKEILIIPGIMNLTNSLKFLKDLEDCKESKSLTFDCSYINHVEPFAMLLVSSAIKQFRINYPHKEYYTRNIPNSSYPAHMGFFSNATLSYPLKSKRGNPSYTPIIEKDCDMIKSQAYELKTRPSEIVADDAVDLARVLSRKDNGIIFDFLKYSIQEMLRNVIEHSDSKKYYYCSQYWPSKDWVEIAILDFGIGLKSSLEMNPDITVYDDINALNLALTPGITKSKYSSSSDSIWRNQGFGLYMTSRLCSDSGSFTILSGKYGLVKFGETSQYIETNINGTGVKLCLRPSTLLTQEKVFDRYISEAKLINTRIDSAQLGKSPSTILKKIR